MVTGHVRWSSYTVTIIWELAWADIALVILDKWTSYRGGRLTRFDCIFLYRFIKVLMINIWWLNAICWSSCLFGIFMIKKCVQFSLTSSGTVTENCVIKTLQIFSFLPLINRSVSIWLSSLLLIISAIISSKAINTLHFLSGFHSSMFLYTSCILFEWASHLTLLFLCFLIRYWNFA